MRMTKPTTLSEFWNFSNPSRGEFKGFLNLANIVTTSFPWLNSRDDCSVRTGKNVDLILTCSLSPKWKLGISWTGHSPDDAVKFALVGDRVETRANKPQWKTFATAEAFHRREKLLGGNQDVIGALSALNDVWRKNRETYPDGRFQKRKTGEGFRANCWSGTSLRAEAGRHLWVNPNGTSLGVLEKQSGIFFDFNDGKGPVETSAVPDWYALFEKPGFFADGMIARILFATEMSVISLPFLKEGDSWTGDVKPSSPEFPFPWEQR